MRYTLWSRGRLVGHTDLDVHTVTPTMRQGFVEPTDDGRPLLADATAVWRALAEKKRGQRARGELRETDHSLVEEAIRRRENLDLELRDEQGVLFECDFIRVTDLFDIDGGIVDEMCDTEEEIEAEFQIRVSALSGDDRDKALAERAEMEAEVDAAVTEMLEDRDDARMFGSSWPPLAPEDSRFETMQYLLQAHLKTGERGDLEL
jgi:hypothetical protein